MLGKRPLSPCSLTIALQQNTIKYKSDALQYYRGDAKQTNQRFDNDGVHLDINYFGAELRRIVTTIQSGKFNANFVRNRGKKSKLTNSCAVVTGMQLAGSRRSILDDLNCTVWIIDNFMKPDEATQLYNTLFVSTRWNREGTRDACFYGERPYAYGSVRHPTSAIPDYLDRLISRVNSFLTADKRVNSVLCNRYIDGNNTISWHADNEKCLGRNPEIFSLSLWATRKFQLKNNKNHDVINVDLVHGSLLYMGGCTQEFWKHSVSKDTSIKRTRINLTFRKIY